MAELTLGSLFDGIGGWLIAAKRYGIRPVWASEIEPFPIQVTKKWHPEVEHLGDVTKLDGGQLPPVDIICAGSPCQDLSVAGRMKGLEGERSGLFRNAVRLFQQMRAATNGTKGRFFVWENVVGAMQSNRGHDFRSVLEEISQTKIPMPRSGRWAGAGMVRGKSCTIVWRIIDAQFWGVPQRRRRIFLVADFGAPGERRPEILFKPESLCGYSPQGYTAWQDNPGQAADCTEKAICIRERCGCEGGGKGLLYGDDFGQSTFSETSYGGWKPVIGAAATLKARGGTLDGGSETLSVVENVVRKLTPVECERLQGLPDGYTEGGSVTARYKALGNGMAQPCADYIMAVVKTMSEAK